MPGNQTLAYSLIENGFEPNIIPDIDGSGYLIDTDNDGKADLISLMLVDQGWFDTRQDTIGLIGDPLTPISLRTVDEEPQDTNGTDPTTEDPEEPLSNGESSAPSRGEENTNPLRLNRQSNGKLVNGNTLRNAANINTDFDNKLKTQENSFSNPSFNYKPSSKNRNIGTSQNTYESNQMPQQRILQR